MWCSDQALCAECWNARVRYVREYAAWKRETEPSRREHEVLTAEWREGTEAEYVRHRSRMGGLLLLAVMSSLTAALIVPANVDFYGSADPSVETAAKLATVVAIASAFLAGVVFLYSVDPRQPPRLEIASAPPEPRPCAQRNRRPSYGTSRADEQRVQEAGWVQQQQAAQRAAQQKR